MMDAQDLQTLLSKDAFTELKPAEVPKHLERPPLLEE